MAGGRFRFDVMPSDLPDSELQRALILQNELIARATGGPASEEIFRATRQEILKDEKLRALAPEFLQSCRTLEQFWAFIKPKFKSYQERRSFLYEAFSSLLAEIEFGQQHPLDEEVASSLERIGYTEIATAWQKALARRHSDPAGAVTAARMLLESTCKHILEENEISYSPSIELTTLYSETAKCLNLAPSQHSENTFKTILGNANQVVSQLASLRNQMSDAHGRGKKSVRPAPRHSALAVNLAGAVAMFLIETWEHNKQF
jgi:Abortive infection C-terminus